MRRSIHAIAVAGMGGVCGLGLPCRAAAQVPDLPDPYVRYTRPGECVQAAIRLKAFYWRDKRPDTVVYAPATDSVPAMVARQARACMSRFAMGALPERDLLDFVQLALWSGDDTLAHAAAIRLQTLQSHRSDLERGWTLYLLVSTDLTVRPARTAAATEALARLDSLGVGAAVWQMMAHTVAIDYAMGVNDVTSARAHGREAIAASGRMARNDRVDRVLDIVRAYNAYAEPLAIQAGGPAAVALFDTALVALPPLRAAEAPSMGGMMHGDIVVQGGGVVALSAMMRAMAGGVDQMQIKQALEMDRDPYTILGTVRPPLVVAHWYNAGGDTTRRPKPGFVSFLVAVNASCGGLCYRTYATVRRLADQFRTKGVQVIVLSATSGYFRNHPLPNPTIESDTLGNYFSRFLALPGVVGVDETAFSNRMDGMRIDQPTESERDYFHGFNGAIVGADGRVNMVIGVQAERERVIAALLTAALNKAHTDGASSGGATSGMAPPTP